MGEKVKILRIKVGEVFINKEIGNKNVFMTAYKKTSKDGKTNYYETKTPIFVNEIELKEKKEDQSSGDV